MYLLVKKKNYFIYLYFTIRLKVIFNTSVSRGNETRLANRRFALRHPRYHHLISAQYYAYRVKTENGSYTIRFFANISI